MASPDDLQSLSTLTRDQVEAFVVRPLAAQSVVLSTPGVRVIDVQEGKSLRIPRFHSYSINHGGTSPTYNSAGTYWVPENTPIPEAGPDADEIVLLPSTLRSVKVGYRASNELIRHTVVDLLNAVGTEVVRQAGLALDQAFLFGDGANDTPTGLTHQSGIYAPGTVGSLGNDVDPFFDAHEALLSKNVTPSVWYMNPKTFSIVRKVKDSFGRYLVQPDPQAANQYVLIGLPIRLSTQIADGTVLVADASQIVVARDLAVNIQIFRERYSDLDQTYVRLTARYDIGVLHAEGIGVLTGVAA